MEWKGGEVCWGRMWADTAGVKMGGAAVRTGCGTFVRVSGVHMDGQGDRVRFSARGGIWAGLGWCWC
eukprot:354533-Chlamydomonas_euryale.AAC.1